MVPAALVRYLLGSPSVEDLLEVRDGLAFMQLVALPEVRFSCALDDAHLEGLARKLITLEGVHGAKRFVRSVVVTGGMLEGALVQEKRGKS